MNKSFSVSLAALAALLLAGSALAQTIPDSNPSAVDARVDRHCTSATLSADASAPCSGDVLNDRPGESPVVARPPGNSTAGSSNMSSGSTETSMGNMGVPSTGTVSSGTSSIPGAMGTGAASASGEARMPARR